MPTIQPLLQLTYQIVTGDTHIFKKDLIEFRLPGDLLERSDGDAGTVHIHDKTGQPLVFGHGRIGAGQQKAKGRIVSITRPHFLPVNARTRRRPGRPAFVTRPGQTQTQVPNTPGTRFPHRSASSPGSVASGLLCRLRSGWALPCPGQ